MNVKTEPAQEKSADHQSVGGNTAEHKIRSIEEATDGLRFAMLTLAETGNALTSRPLTVARVHGNRVSFLVDGHAEWLRSLGDQKPVNLALTDGSDGRYVSLSGRAELSRDDATVQSLWSAADKAWFDGPEDPSIAALHVNVAHGEFWDGPGNRALAGIKLAAQAAGMNVDMGERGEVRP